MIECFLHLRVYHKCSRNVEFPSIKQNNSGLIIFFLSKNTILTNALSIKLSVSLGKNIKKN